MIGGLDSRSRADGAPTLAQLDGRIERLARGARKEERAYRETMDEAVACSNRAHATRVRLAEAKRARAVLLGEAAAEGRCASCGQPVPGAAKR